jgi:GNAT superfamily N-acetyltransferase
MKSVFPTITSELATRIEACIVSFSQQKLLALGSISGNPYGMHTRLFGNATALLAQRTHNSELFNRVGNISDSDLPYLENIIDWYQTYGVRCSFDIIPSNASPLLLWQLATKGFYQSGFYSTLYGLPNTETPSFSDITVRPVFSEERERFADIYLESFEVPRTEAYSYVRDSVRILVGMPETHCLFALVNKRVAAIGVLYIHQHTGYLALAATLPSFRGHGCQRALLQTRIALAAEAGCDLITSQAGIATVSHKNLEEVGLRIAYTKVQWTPYNQQEKPDMVFDPVNR